MAISKSVLDLMDQFLMVAQSNHRKVFNLLFIRVDDDSKREVNQGS